MTTKRTIKKIKVMLYAEQEYVVDETSYPDSCPLAMLNLDIQNFYDDPASLCFDTNSVNIKVTGKIIDLDGVVLAEVR